jgi:perosamine synthetase
MTRFHTPSRRPFGLRSVCAITGAMVNAYITGKDLKFQGYAEERFCSEFRKYISHCGYVDLVNSGTNAIWVSLMALGASREHTVVISPATNPGSIMPVALALHNIVIADSRKGEYNISPDEFLFTVKTYRPRFAVLTHHAGLPLKIDILSKIAKEYGVMLVEDCSQAAGADVNGRKIGTFGDISVWSTMYSKTLTSGGCGGIVFTKSLELYSRIRAYADRGKNFADPDFDFRKTDLYLYPALNCNQTDMASILCHQSLKKLDKVNRKRQIFVESLSQLLAESDIALKPLLPDSPDSTPAFFFLTLVAETTNARDRFAALLRKSGVPCNSNYRDIPAEWKWLEGYLRHNPLTPNVIDLRNRSINLTLHEGYRIRHARQIVDILSK